MLRRSRKTELTREAREYFEAHGPFAASQLAEELLNKGWEPSQTSSELLSKEISALLGKSQDDEGVRTWLVVKPEQAMLWSPREMASWTVKNDFLQDQRRRLRDDVRALQKLVETFNRERKDDEPEFQLGFEFKWE